MVGLILTKYLSKDEKKNQEENLLEPMAGGLAKHSMFSVAVPQSYHAYWNGRDQSPSTPPQCR